MTDSVVVEGYVKIRDGKKWKTRWVALRKPSPVADCLVLQVFKDKSDKAQGHKAKVGMTLEDICGLDLGQWYEGACYSLAVLCLNQATLLGFDSREALLAWDIRIRYSLGEVHRFSVGVLPGTKLESGPATLHLCNNLLALARDVPPVIIAHWNLSDLRRYGPVPNGFVFEGGTRCGYWAGVFLLASTESEQISFLFDCIVRGISPTRAPFGVRPLLPDPSQAPSEERVNQEAQELGKRLSMLSHCSNTASSIYGPSVAGDDRSISGSSDTSDTSQSDSSISSRLAIWPDPAPGPSPPENPALSDAKVPLKGIEKLSISQGGGARPAAKAPRQLQEIGRQSSSDSGIATGSHSSYSGSFSSYTGSLDIGSGEDFGSAFSSPPHLDRSPCTCLPAPGHEYQAPSSLRYLYDSPKSLLLEGSSKPTALTVDNGSLPTPTSEPPEGDKESALVSMGQSDTADRQSTNEGLSGPVEENSKAKVAPSCDKQHTDLICTSVTSVSKAICSTCGGLKGTHYSVTGGSAIPALPEKKPNRKAERCKGDPAYEIMESQGGKSAETEEKSKYELMGICGHQRFLREPEEVPSPDRPRGDSVTYVNIPISPTSKKQLNYMELELQEPGVGMRGLAGTHLPPQRKGSTKYAQIDITATETAHRVGTQHALGREEGLHALEMRRRGALQ